MERCNLFTYVDTIEQTLIEELGETAFINAVTRAMSYYDKQEIYEYIARCYDIDIKECEEDD